MALIWGSSFFLIEIGLEAFEPGLISWLRIVAGLGTLVLFPSARRPIDRQDRPRVAILGMTWVAIPFVLFPIAQQHIDSALAGMINALAPIFAGLFAAAFLRAIPGKKQLLGIGLGFVGAVGISLPALQGSAATALGVAMVASATVFYGLSMNLLFRSSIDMGARPS